MSPARRASASVLPTWLANSEPLSPSRPLSTCSASAEVLPANWRCAATRVVSGLTTAAWSAGAFSRKAVGTAPWSASTTPTGTWASTASLPTSALGTCSVATPLSSEVAWVSPASQLPLSLASRQTRAPLSRPSTTVTCTAVVVLGVTGVTGVVVSSSPPPQAASPQASAAPSATRRTRRWAAGRPGDRRWMAVCWAGPWGRACMRMLRWWWLSARRRCRAVACTIGTSLRAAHRLNGRPRPARLLVKRWDDGAAGPCQTARQQVTTASGRRHAGSAAGR